MLLIQIVLISCLAVLTIYTLRSDPGTVHLAVRRTILSCLALIAIFFVVFPEALSKLADFFGIGRGTDLLVYGMVIVILLNSISNRRNHRASQRVTTILAREIAIQEAIRES